MALTDKLTAIADAIRAKTGKTDSMTLDEMVVEINSIIVGEAAEPDFSLKHNGVEVRELTMTSTGDTFEVVAKCNTLNSADISYKWQIYISAANMWVDISGQTSDTITINYGMVKNQVDNNTALIQCVATVGSESATSEQLAVILNLPPV